VVGAHDWGWETLTVSPTVSLPYYACGRTGHAWAAPANSHRVLPAQDERTGRVARVSRGRSSYAQGAHRGGQLACREGERGGGAVEWWGRHAKARSGCPPGLGSNVWFASVGVLSNVDGGLKSYM